MWHNWSGYVVCPAAQVSTPSSEAELADVVRRAARTGQSIRVAGGDPEKMKQLPNVAGLKSEVIMPRQSRNDYDHAYRTVGARIVEVDTPQDLQSALGE